MTNDSSHQITLLLNDWSKGDEYALEQLMPLVYDELRRMARRYMKNQPAGHTFQATELIHETYLKLEGGQEQNWQNREHFFGVAAQAMRHILVDYARSKSRKKQQEKKNEKQKTHFNGFADRFDLSFEYRHRGAG